MLSSITSTVSSCAAVISSRMLCARCLYAGGMAATIRSTASIVSQFHNSLQICTSCFDSPCILITPVPSSIQPCWPMCLQVPLYVKPGQVHDCSVTVYVCPLLPITVCSSASFFSCLNGLGVTSSNLRPLLSNPLIGFLK